MKLKCFLLIFLACFTQHVSSQEPDSEDDGPTSETSLNMMNFLRAAAKCLQPDCVELVRRTFLRKSCPLVSFALEWPQGPFVLLPSPEF